MKAWVYGAAVASVLLVSIPWGYKKWHVHQYCTMVSEQVTCARVESAMFPGTTVPLCQGDIKRMEYRYQQHKPRLDEFLADQKEKSKLQKALPKAQEFAYRKCVVESL